MRVVLLSVFCALLIGCSQTPPTKFYTLTGSLESADTDAEVDVRWPQLALAPVALPAYLDRPQFVVRLDATRMQIADFDSWIEPLDDLVQRTLAVNLERDGRIGQVLKLPQRRPVAFNIGVEVQIDIFEARADNMAVIDADWLLIDDQERELARASFVSQVPIGPPAGFAERSMALSLLLVELADDILKALPQES